MGTKLGYSTTCHLQADEHTEVTNQTLGTLVRALIKPHTGAWDLLLPHAEFAFNKEPNKPTRMSLFKVVYGIDPLSPLILCLDLWMKSQVRMQEKNGGDSETPKASQARIEKSNTSYQTQANKHKKRMVFQPGKLVWVHLRKECSPTKYKSKLMPRADGPFEILNKGK